VQALGHGSGRSGQSGWGTPVALNAHRLQQVLAAIGGRGDDAIPMMMRLCRVCPELLPVDGAGVSVITESVPLRVAASDSLASAVEDLQTTTHEGPCFDAMAKAGPVVVRDLTDREWSERWPRFTDGALELEARALVRLPAPRRR